MFRTLSRILVAASLIGASVPTRSAVAEAPGDSGLPCTIMASSAPDSSELKQQIKAVMDQALASADWTKIRAGLWYGADPQQTRGTPWYKRALQEKRNIALVNAAAAGDDAKVGRAGGGCGCECAARY